jgi:hypothetical protein
MSLGMTKRWRCLYRWWYKKSSGRVSIVVRELSVLGKLRILLHLPLYSVLSFLVESCLPTTLHRSHHHIGQPFEKTWISPGQNIFTITTSNTTTTTLILNNVLNSNHNPLPAPRNPQVRLRETRRRPLQLARSLATRLALSRRHEDFLATARHLFIIATDEPLATTATKTPANPNIRPYLLAINKQTQTLRSGPRPPHNPKHDRLLDRTPHNARRNAALPTLVSRFPTNVPSPNPRPPEKATATERTPTPSTLASD